MKDLLLEPMDGREWRCGVYFLIAVIAVGSLFGRIMHVRADHGRTPFLSANDRSRWSTIRSLVDHGTFILDDVILKPDGKWNKDWATIDLVRHRGHDGNEHYYSSKPPLLTVLLAGEYWLVKNLTGSTLAEKPMYVGRLMIALTNLPLFVVYLGLIVLLVKRFGRSDLAKVFVIAAAAFGTAVTPFVVSLSNHLPAAVACAATLALVVRIVESERLNWLSFVLTGLVAAFTVVCELPALSIFPFVGLALACRSPWNTLLGFVPAALLIATAAVATNYLAHGTIKPAYGQRKDGPVLATTNVPIEPGRIQADLRRELREKTDLGIHHPIAVIYAGGENRFVLWEKQTQQRLALVLDPASKEGQPTWQIRQWGNWYDYPGSYWITDRQGVDRGEASRAAYLFQMFLGHHGLLSLTPIWLLSFAGGYLAIRDRGMLRWIAIVAGCLLVICVAFYLSRPQIDRNYGGVSCTFRWLLWQIPLWLVLMLPAVERLLKFRWGMALCGLLLAASVFSAEYNALNPWTKPWLYDYWESLGWIEE